MLISQGPTRTLRGRPWAGIELSSDTRIEEHVLHLARWAGESRVGQAFELLFPVEGRGIEGVSLVSPYFWARMRDLRDLEGIASVPGVSLVRDTKHAIAIEDGFVQRIMETARGRAAEWSVGLRKGSFVRVLLGNERYLCGEVERYEKGIAVVVIELVSRRMRLTISGRALGVLEVGKRERKYYYRGEGK